MKVFIKLMVMYLGLGFLAYGQNDAMRSVFSVADPLAIDLSLSTKKIRKHTNDSTYLQATFKYLDLDGLPHSLNAGFRKRGNFRLKSCYYPPLKVKLKKNELVGTPFFKNRKFKMVLPCFKEKGANDLVVKELMAYKLYEIVAPFHFKTRMVDIDFKEERNRKIKRRNLKGFLIEDIDDLAKRLDAHQLKRKVHPLEQDANTSIINAFFQYMIGNTDFSTGYQHNEKLIFKEGRSYPIPYDFDMSGLVNAPYAVVSQIQGRQLPIEKVTQRWYRGFERNHANIFEVRNLFLNSKDKIFMVLEKYRPYFENLSEFKKAKDFIAGFFKAIADEDRFENLILAHLRQKMALDTITPN